jgi:hypothetical protein
MIGKLRDVWSRFERATGRRKREGLTTVHEGVARAPKIVPLALCASLSLCAAPLRLRLQTPLTSYDSGTGDRFRAVVIAPYERDGRVLLPSGTIVFGAVRRAKAVQMGIVRERASLDLAFDGYELPDGRRFPIGARLQSIDNSREAVAPNGEIHGILAANNPHSFVGGMWFSPKAQLMSRSFIGLTGATGRLAEAYSMGPIGALGLVALRCALFKMPEPEIRLPAGAELTLVVYGFAAEAPTFDPEPDAEVPAEIADWVQDQPFGVTRATGLLAADIINVAFRGSREDIVAAFAQAGWVKPEPMSKSSLAQGYRAYSGQSGFAAAPVSKLLYRNAGPDLVFEKSLNTLAKRHHIRVWKARRGDDLWLAAATHDVRVGFASGSITHHINPRVDMERAKVVNDLAFAGCAGPAGYVDRPTVARTVGQPGTIETDGRVALISLRRDCGAGVPPAVMELPDPPGSRIARLVRRMILEGRQYALRGHPYYWGYRLMTLKSSRKERATPED